MLKPRKFDRRKFLKTSTAAAFGLGLVGSSRAYGANEKIRAAVIGVKGRGGNHIEGFLDLKEGELAALCDVDEGGLRVRLEGVGKKNGSKPAAFTGLKELIEDQSH